LSAKVGAASAKARSSARQPAKRIASSPEGLAPREHIGRREQLEAFTESLAAQTKAPKITLDSWPQAFKLLASLLPSSGSTVLLLDEISWMAIGAPDFAGHLKTAWDNLKPTAPLYWL
jgi:hypothetical protein